MNKTVKNSLIIIAIVVVLFGMIWLVYDMLKKEPVDTKVNANLADENTGLDNIINDLFDNSQTNEQKENVIESENITNSQKEEDKTNEVSDGNIESVTTREERAVELVKKEWGSTDGVYFSNESVDSQGRYIVSVRDKKTTTSLAFYLVDVDKQLVTQQ